MKKPTKYTIIVGIFFFILFTAYSSFSNIITQIHEQDGDTALGPALLASNYGMFMIANVIAPGISLSYKTQMTIAALCYSINFGSGLTLQFLPTILKYIVTILAASIAGFGAAMLWTSLGGYIHMLCQQNKVEYQKGKYFGLFQAIYCAQSISGSLITTFCLGFFSHEIYFIIITSIGILASLFCFLFVKPLQNSQPKKQFKAIKAFKNIISFYPRMKYSLPLIFMDGIIIGIINSSLTHMLPQTADKQQANINAGIAFILYGVGSIIGGYGSGILSDKWGLKSSGNFNIYIFIFTCSLSLYSLIFQKFILSCSVFFSWGLCLYYIQGWMMVVCSRIYAGQLESFSITKQFHSFSFILYEFFIIFTGNQINLKYVFPIILLLSIPSLMGLYALFEKEASRKSLIQSSLSLQRQENVALLDSQA